MPNAIQVLHDQISLQHVQHSLTDAAVSLLGARSKKPTGHQEVAGASLARMLFGSKKLHGMRWQFSANKGNPCEVWCYELWSNLICSWGSSTKNQNCWSHRHSRVDVSRTVQIRYWPTSRSPHEQRLLFWLIWMVLFPSASPSCSSKNGELCDSVFQRWPSLPGFGGTSFFKLLLPRSSSYLILKLILDFLKKPVSTCFLPRIKAVVHIGKDYICWNSLSELKKALNSSVIETQVVKLSQYHLFPTLQP